MRIALACCLALMLLAQGCAAVAEHEKQRSERLQVIEKFLLLERLKPLQRVDFGFRPQWSFIDEQQLVVWKFDREPVLLRFEKPCTGLHDAGAIRVGDSPGRHSIRAGQDPIYPLRETMRPSAGEPPAFPCRVMSMYPLSGRQLDTLRERLREIAEAR